MCVISAVGDNWGKRVPEAYPWVYPQPAQPNTTVTWPVNAPSREEFDKLKAEVEELKKLLLAAKKFDEATEQPDCHMDDKVALIRKLAEYVGVDVSEIFGGGTS